jgi:hypothetical protein
VTDQGKQPSNKTENNSDSGFGDGNRTPNNKVLIEKNSLVNKLLKKNKKVLLTFGGLLIFGLVCLFSIVLLSTNNTDDFEQNDTDDLGQTNQLPTNMDGACTSGVASKYFRNSIEFLDPVNIDKLVSSNENIMKAEEYNQDVNCLFPLLVQAVNMSDPENARQYYEQLLSLHEEGQEISPEIIHPLTDMGTLLDTVDFLERQQQIVDHQNKNYDQE